MSMRAPLAVPDGIRAASGNRAMRKMAVIGAGITGVTTVPPPAVTASIRATSFRAGDPQD